MYNTKFITVDGKDLYPGYLGREQRAFVRDQYRGKKEYMWCACRPDAGLYLMVHAASSYLLQGIPGVGYHMIWWNTLFSWGLGCVITWTHFLRRKCQIRF